MESIWSAARDRLMLIGMRHFWIGAMMVAAVLAAGRPGALAAPDALAESGPPPLFGARETVLANGLRLVVIENRRAPVVTHMIWYQVGAADEKTGHSGLAHYLEHLLFKGTHDHPAGVYSRMITGAGGDHNAFTMHDATAYFATVTPAHLETIMRLEADRMRHLTFDPVETKRELSVVMEERNQVLDTHPPALLFERMQAALFPNHPYGRPIIGWDKEMIRMTPEDARDFYNSWYHPHNAIVVISGAISFEHAVELATAIYGTIVTGPAQPPRAWPQPPDPIGPVVIAKTDPRIHQDQLFMMLRAPSYVTDIDRAVALDILASALGDGSTGHLYNELVRTQKIATDVSFDYDGSRRDHSALVVSALPADGVSLNDLQRAIISELDDALAGGLTRDALTRARDRLIDESIFYRDSVTGPAMIVGHGLAIGLDLATINGWAGRVRALPDHVIDGMAQTIRADIATGLVIGFLLRDRPEDAHTAHNPPPSADMTGAVP